MADRCEMGRTMSVVMLRGTLIAVGLLVALDPTPLSAAPYTFETVDVPLSGVTGTYGWGINDGGQIVGSYSDGVNVYGFTYANGSFVTGISVPSGIDTKPTGINNLGELTGNYSDSSGAHGFVYTGGSFVRPLDVPWPPGGTYPQAINANGHLVGYSQNHGFIYAAGVFALLDVPGATVGTSAQGINDAGVVVGYYDAGAGCRGFILDAGVFTTDIAAPQALNCTIIYGISNSGVAAGTFFDAAGAHGFVYENGAFSAPIDVPGATLGTYVFGINTDGQLVGYFGDRFGEHAFIARPAGMVEIPEPSGILVLVGAMVTLAARSRRDRNGRAAQFRMCSTRWHRRYSRIATSPIEALPTAASNCSTSPTPIAGMTSRSAGSIRRSSTTAAPI